MVSPVHCHLCPLCLPVTCVSVVLPCVNVMPPTPVIHVPTGCLYVFFGKMSVKVFCPFFNWVVWFFVTELFMYFVDEALAYCITY